MNFFSQKSHNKPKQHFQKRKKASLFLLGFIIIFLIALTFPKNRYSEFSYKINDVTRETIIAPFDFPILKNEKNLQRDREEALKNVPFVFIQDIKTQENQISQLNSFFAAIEKIHLAKSKYETSKKLLEKYRYSKKHDEIYSLTQTDSVSYFNLINEFQKSFKFDANSLVFKALILSSNNEQKVTSYTNLLPKLKRILSNILAQLVIDISKDEIISEEISIKQEGEELLEDPDQVLTLEEAWTKVKLILQAEYPESSSEVIDISNDIIVHFLKPNLIFQKEITESRQNEAINKVPISRGIVLENEKIVDANTKITPEIYRKLESLSKERARRTNIRGGLRTSLPLIGDPIIFLGQIALVGIILSFFITFLLTYRPNIIKDHKMIVLIGIIFIMQSILAFIFVENFNISEYSIPITMAAMTLTILFDSRVAFIGTGTLSILIGTQLGGNISFIITSIFASSLAVYSVRKLRKRSQVFQSIIYIILGYAVAISITELLHFSSTTVILNHFLFAGINSIVAPFLTYGIIGLLESAFGITTDLSLLELADFNHPLLKLLSKEATGTFTHSVTVGNLAEAAADAIGANSLLARVGAYYHDIGKITKPEYFVENQSYDENKHDKLAPNLSALIIINHVKEGLRLANEYKLPKVIVDFIPSHHGTTRVEYFYNRALKQAENSSDINESDFRYPGPKPKTKETGIVMICESIEAATRSIKKPTVANIKKIVNQIIDNRLKEKQLDECPLTFSDLGKIKGDIKENYGILPILKGIHHLRIEYPGQEIPKKSQKSKSTDIHKS